MNYEMLDMKSMRIIKRFLHFLSSQSAEDGGLDFASFMQELISKQTVKTKSSNAEVLLFSSQKFFKKLAKYNIKKTSTQHPNLQQFLCIDLKYQGFLMFRKLKKCMQDFNKSRFVRALGHKKNKLDLAEYSSQEMMLEEENDFVPND